MSIPAPAALRPLGHLKHAFRAVRCRREFEKSLSTTAGASKTVNLAQRASPIPPIPVQERVGMKKIKVYPPPASTRLRFPDPVKALSQDQISVLDPTGARTRLFAKENREGAKVGDVLLVRLKSGEPYAGVCINIRRRGVDTAILLRNQLTRVATEVWYKIYSPNVEGIEIVQRIVDRKGSRARRARLTYMRKPDHDLGSVENIVHQYLQRRSGMRGGSSKRSQRSKR